MIVNPSPHHHQDSDNKRHRQPPPPPPTTASLSTQSSKIDAAKRPRTSTACVRCHLKKVRCDGRRPNCDRCAANDKMCAYPTRRRSRNTQPADVDPLIDDLSHLEQRIRGIESEQEALWHVFQQYQQQAEIDGTDLVSRLTIIDQHVQTSRASLARQRLLREQHIARNKHHRDSTSPSNDGTDKSNPKKRTTKTTSLIKRNKRQQKQRKQQQQQEQHEQHEQRQQVSSTTATGVSTIQVQPPPSSPQLVNDSPYWFPNMNNEECEYFSAAAAATTTVQQHHLYSQAHLSTNNELLSPIAELHFDTKSTPPHPLLYQSSSTSTVHSSSSASPSSVTTPLQSFHMSSNNNSNNEMMIDSSPYGLMNFVMDEDSLMLNYPQEGDSWLGHPRL